MRSFGKALSGFLACWALTWLLATAGLLVQERAMAQEKAATGKEPPLISRSVFLGDPDRAAVRISPDGKLLAYLAPSQGVLNVWVAPIDQPDKARVVTSETKRSVSRYSWLYTSRHLVYYQDQGGNENWHIYLVDLETGQKRDLTPVEGVSARLAAVSPKFPTRILISLNDRVPQLHDVYEVDIATGKRHLVQKNPGFLGFVIDEDYRVRFAMQFAPDGGTLMLRPNQQGKWEPFLKIPQEDSLTTSPLDFDKTGQVLYMLDSRGRDTAALVAWDLKTDKRTLLAEDPRADIGGAFLHPETHQVLAVTFTYDRKRWKVLDDSVKPDFDYLQRLADGELSITSTSQDLRHWIVAYIMDNGPVRYYHYDRQQRRARFLFTNRKELEGLPLVRMHPVIIQARDGLKLVSYLSLPLVADPDQDGKPQRPVPMVLLVHGGPWARDTWGYHPIHQWLANRGYAVLSVNFRGSTGFGKRFLNAGNRQWGAKMHDDLLDAVQWAVDRGIAPRDKVGIMGGSYGGYATLVGLTFTPEVFACGVDIVGPSNLITLLNTIPPYWKPALKLFQTRVGDHTTEEGRRFLRSRSPLTYVDRIRRPLLIGQGANDPRVKQSESDQIVQAMQKKRIPVIYVVFPDEGHGFVRKENRLAFNAVVELFLHRHLGGRYQPIGNDFQGSSIQVRAGAELLPGLKEALEALRQSE